MHKRFSLVENSRHCRMLHCTSRLHTGNAYKHKSSPSNYLYRLNRASHALVNKEMHPATSSQWSTTINDSTLQAMLTWAMTSMWHIYVSLFKNAAKSSHCNITITVAHTTNSAIRRVQPASYKENKGRTIPNPPHAFLFYPLQHAHQWKLLKTALTIYFSD